MQYIIKCNQTEGKESEMNWDATAAAVVICMNKQMKWLKLKKV